MPSNEQGNFTLFNINALANYSDERLLLFKIIRINSRNREVTFNSLLLSLSLCQIIKSLKNSDYVSLMCHTAQHSWLHGALPSHFYHLSKPAPRQVPVAHTCNPSYSGGRDQVLLTFVYSFFLTFFSLVAGLYIFFSFVYAVLQNL
jgi:hypothetical protein